MGRRAPGASVALLAAVVILGCGAPRRPARPVPPPSPSSCVPAGRWVVPATGEPVPAATLVERALAGRIVLLGERHDRAEHHRWQLQTLAALHAARPTIVVGFEAFPRRVQPVLDRWVAGTTSTEEFLAATDWPHVWGFDPALYLPLFHFARMNRLPMVGLNVDRGLVRRVAAEGWAAIPPAERRGLGDPAPPAEAYVAWLATAHGEPRRPDDPAFRRFVEAQLVWDRAMAETLVATARAHPDALVVGILGAGHLEHGWGVPHQLRALGVPEATVWLPWDAARDCTELVPGLADAVFGLAWPG